MDATSLKTLKFTETSHGLWPIPDRPGLKRTWVLSPGKRATSLAPDVPQTSFRGFLQPKWSVYQPNRLEFSHFTHQKRGISHNE